MTTQFEKIYVISLISNKDRQEFVKYQMDELGLDFEFIYGIDFYNIKLNRYEEEINWPSTVIEYPYLDNSKVFSCAIGHYQAVLQSYVFGYNNVLVLEDDICFIKDKELIHKYLNDIPTNIDFVTYNTRFISKYELDVFKYYQQLHINDNNDFIKIPNKFTTLCGGMMYGIMNRKTMELYLNSQRNKFQSADHIDGIFENSIIERYSSVYSICMDQYNRLRQGKKYTSEGISYDQTNIISNYDDYYKPSQFSNISLLNNKLEKSIIWKN